MTDQFTGFPPIVEPAPEFKPWPKIARLNRDIVITEKLDGTNAAVGVKTCDPGEACDGCDNGYACIPQVYAQSRTRIITPQADNFGFARWVADHADALAATLGPGLHFGEWWGNGIQRGYDLAKGDKRFSLFNTARWRGDAAIRLQGIDGDAVRPVPVLYEGPFDQARLNGYLSLLATFGSRAAPGFMKPEGIVVFHTAANNMFKVTIENDEQPKGITALEVQA